MKLGLSFYLLANLFEIDERTASEYFQMVLVMHNHINNDLLKSHTKAKTNSEKDANYARMIVGDGEFEDEIRRAFKDPHPTKNRIPVVLVADSKKVQVNKSTDKKFQQDCYYKVSNKHFVNFLTICNLSGVPVFQASASASSSPRHGNRNWFEN